MWMFLLPVILAFTRELWMRLVPSLTSSYVFIVFAVAAFCLPGTCQGRLITWKFAQPRMRLDAIGKHTVAAGASPQIITSALTYEPLKEAGLTLSDVDKYAPELHNPEITLPAGAGNVPEANFKMIAALGVMDVRKAADAALCH